MSATVAELSYVCLREAGIQTAVCLEIVVLAQWSR